MTLTAEHRARLQSWTPEQYHADPCESPSLSASIATTLVTQSPLHAWSKHPRFGAQRTPPTPSMDEGTLIHALLLGVGDIKEIPFDDYRTKAAKEARDAAIADGALPVKARDLDHAKEVAAKLRAGMAAFGIELTGRSEQAMTWTEQSAYGDIVARGMMDHVFVDEGRIVDLKKISSADEHTCANHAYRYGYDIQAAAYRRGLAQIVPSLSGRITYMWLFLEIEPPYCVVPRVPDGSMRELGESRWLRACEIWGRCISRNEWPAYVTQPAPLGPPSWAMNVEMGMEAAE